MLLAVDGLKDAMTGGEWPVAVVVADHPATGCHGGGGLYRRGKPHTPHGQGASPCTPAVPMNVSYSPH